MSQEKLLEMQGIQKRFHGVHALKGVNFDLNCGEVHALVGENGAGKTTTIKACTGLLNFEAGEIYINGISIKERYSRKRNERDS